MFLDIIVETEEMIEQIITGEKPTVMPIVAVVVVVAIVIAVLCKMVIKRELSNAKRV